MFNLKVYDAPNVARFTEPTFGHRKCLAHGHESQYRAILIDLEVVKTALPLSDTYALLDAFYAVNSNLTVFSSYGSLFSSGKWKLVAGHEA